MRAGAKEFLPQPVRIEDLVARPRPDQRAAHRPRRPQEARQHRDRRRRRDRRRGHDQPGGQPGLRPGRTTRRTPWRWSISTCAWATPTCSSTRFPTTRWSMSPRTSRGSTSRCSSGRSPSTPRGLYLLPRPVQLEDVDADHARRPAARARPAQGHVHAPDPRPLEELHARSTWSRWKSAKHILLVTQLDLPCLRNVVRLMMSFNEIDGLKDKVKIVVNRVGLDNGADQPEEGPGNDRPRDLLAAAQRLPHDGRGPQQRRAADRAGPQGRHHAVDHATGRSAVGEPTKSRGSRSRQAGKKRWLSIFGPRSQGQVRSLLWPERASAIESPVGAATSVTASTVMRSATRTSACALVHRSFSRPHNRPVDLVCATSKSPCRFSRILLHLP